MVEVPKPSDIPNVFGMNEPQHMFAKFAWELQHLTTCMSVWEDHGGYPEPIFRAFNTAVTAWHISDWLWQANPATRLALAYEADVHLLADHVSPIEDRSGGRATLQARGSRSSPVRSRVRFAAVRTWRGSNSGCTAVNRVTR
jgi:hypothetical protein